MKKIILLCIILALSGPLVWARTNPGAPIDDPIITDQGGPDAFGYSWIDNDSAGGPAYNWIDITSYGTRLIGLADDNNLGPIPMGFDFPYYWYTVDHMWIGSNGYLSFSSNANYAHPFTNLPDTRVPNDLLAVLTGDLDFTRGNGSCYYYTNYADTFIVSWINVSEYFTPNISDSVHTFQVILSARDSSITYQYGVNLGTFAGGSGSDVIGIENVNGRTGIQYLRTNAPANHMYHNGLALRFHPVPNPSYVVHDIGVADGFQEGSGAVFVQRNSSYYLRGQVKNYGNQVEATAKLICAVKRGATFVWRDTLDVPVLNPTETIWMDFPNPFIQDTATTFSVTFTTVLTGDQNPNNNILVCELDTYRLPQMLGYCDNIAETGRSWTGNFSGFGLEFQAPEPLKVDSIAFNVWAIIDSLGLGGPAYVWIMPDDGTGRPDINNIIAGDTVNVADTGWYFIDVRSFNLSFSTNTKFYMVALHAFENTFSFAMDQTAPLSNRGWEYTGGLSPDRDRPVSDVMFRIFAAVPPPGTITGLVYNPDGITPEADVIVTAFDGGDVEVGRDTSGVGGDFSFALVGGTYHLLLSKAGFRDTTVQNIVVLAGQNTNVNVVLSSRPACDYVIGDVNRSGSMNGLDVTYSVGYFKGGPPPPYSCECPPYGNWYVAGDVNASCSFNGLDVTYMVGYFKGGPAPASCAACPGH